MCVWWLSIVLHPQSVRFLTGFGSCSAIKNFATTGTRGIQWIVWRQRVIKHFVSPFWLIIAQLLRFSKRTGYMLTQSVGGHSFKVHNGCRRMCKEQYCSFLLYYLTVIPFSVFLNTENPFLNVFNILYLIHKSPCSFVCHFWAIICVKLLAELPPGQPPAFYLFALLGPLIWLWFLIVHHLTRSDVVIPGAGPGELLLCKAYVKKVLVHPENSLNGPIYILLWSQNIIFFTHNSLWHNIHCCSFYRGSNFSLALETHSYSYAYVFQHSTRMLHV